jgi:hypothetical protein
MGARKRVGIATACACLRLGIVHSKTRSSRSSLFLTAAVLLGISGQAAAQKSAQSASSPQSASTSSATLQQGEKLTQPGRASSGAPLRAPAKLSDNPIPVRFTDILKTSGITFVQDSTQTNEKYYLETMGRIDSLEIEWPSGQVDKLTNLPVDKIIAIKEGVKIVPHPKVAIE